MQISSLVLPCGASQSWLPPPFLAALLLAASILCAQTADLNTIITALRSGSYQQARDLSETALKQSPNDPRLWTLNGLALGHLGLDTQALPAYRHALQINPQYVPALEGAAQILYKQHSQEAVPLLEQLVKLHPEDKTSYAMLAVLAFERRDCKSTLTYFNESRALMETQKSSLEEVGTCLVRLRRASEAVPIFERILAFQNEPQARYNLAVVQWLSRKYRDVITTLSPLASTSSPPPDALDLLAEAYEATSDTPKAVEYLRRAIAQNPKAARYYVDFADIALVHASYQVGIDMLNFGLKQLPDAAQLYLARGILYTQMGKYDQSQSDFAKADQLDPHAQEVSEAQGLVALEQSNLAEGERTIRARIRTSPHNAFLYYLLAETLTRKGAPVGSPAFHDAVQAAAEAVRLRPNFALARDVLGRLYLKEGKTAEAIEQSRTAVRDDPTDQTAVYHLILALRKGNQPEEIPALMRQLTQLREQARRKEAEERKYALVEGTK